MEQVSGNRRRCPRFKGHDVRGFKGQGSDSRKLPTSNKLVAFFVRSAHDTERSQMMMSWCIGSSRDDHWTSSRSTYYSKVSKTNHYKKTLDVRHFLVRVNDAELSAINSNNIVQQRNGHSRESTAGNRQRFVGKVVIVTGSSSGIGQHAVVEFGKEGASVVIHGRKVESLNETEEMLRAVGVSPNRILRVVGSMEDDETPQRIIDMTMEKFGRIDVLVNNAGASRKQDCESLSIENLDYLYRLNFRSAVVLTKLAIPYLQRTGGNVVQMSSTASVTPFANVAFYCAMKAALDHFTRCAAIQHGPNGVRLNCLNPGFIRTPIIQRLGKDEKRDQENGKWIVTNTALQRVGELSDVSQILLTLASEEASYVTGACWMVDAGMNIYIKPQDLC